MAAKQQTLGAYSDRKKPRAATSKRKPARKKEKKRAPMPST